MRKKTPNEDRRKFFPLYPCRECGRLCRKCLATETVGGYVQGMMHSPGRRLEDYSSACFECYRNLRKFTRLQNCYLCGRLGGPRRVTYRNECYGWSGVRDVERDLLCVSCWNKVKPIQNARHDFEEARKLIDRIRRKANEKDKDNRRSAGVPC